LLQAAVNGDMASMLAVLSDIHARNIDAQDHALMVIELRYIESETELLQATRPRRHAMAQTTGNEIAAGMGLMALAVAAVVTVLT
jgi:hypothetical protein